MNPWKRIRCPNRNIAVAATLIAVVAAFFLTKWILDGAYFKNDLLLITAPLEDLYAGIQRSGQSPLWAPELAGGYPLLAIGQLGYWYPLHILLRHFLPGVWTLNLSMALHAMLATASTFALLKRNNINSVAAGAAALLLPLGAAFVGKYEMVNLVLPFMWVPLMLLLLQLFLERGRLSYLLAWIGVNVLCVLVGHPQMTVEVFLLEILVALCLCLVGVQKRRWTRLFMAFLGAVLIIGVTAFYLIPIIDNIPDTDRATGIPDPIFEYEFSPSVFRGIVMAHPFGHDRTYNGPPSESELSSYIGPLALGLAILGLFTGRRRYPALWWSSLSLILAGLLLATGEYSSLFTWMVRHGWAYFNFPSRFYFYIHIGLSLLMAIGLDVSIARLRAKHLRMGPIIVGVVLIGTVVPALWVSWTWDDNVPWKFTDKPVLATRLQSEPGFIRVASLQKEDVVNIAPDNDFGIMVWDGVVSQRVYRQTFSSPFATVTGLAIKLSRPSSGRGFVTVRLYTDTGEKLRESSIATQNIVDGEWSRFAFQSVESAEQKGFYFEITSDLAKLQAPRLFIHTNPSEQYDPTGALFTCKHGMCVEVDSNKKPTDAAFKVLTKSTDAVEGQEELAPYISAGFGINSALWKGSLPILDIKKYLKHIEGTAIKHDAEAFLNRLTVTHIVGVYPPYRYNTYVTGLSLVASTPIGDEFIRLYRNGDAFPRLQFVQTIKAASGSDKQMDVLSRLDPNDHTVAVADVDKDVVCDVSGNKARFISDGRTKVVIQTEQNTTGFLVLRDVLLKGWEATIDGQPVTINRVDGIFRGVFVPAGDHEVTFRYSPRWIRLAVFVESVSVAGVVLLFVLAYRQSARHRPSPAVHTGA